MISLFFPWALRRACRDGILKVNVWNLCHNKIHIHTHWYVDSWMSYEHWSLILDLTLFLSGIHSFNVKLWFISEQCFVVLCAQNISFSKWPCSSYSLLLVTSNYSKSTTWLLHPFFLDLSWQVTSSRWLIRGC